MNLKPSDLFIGLFDFFSVLLPGSFVIYIVTDLKIIPYYCLSEASSWVYYSFLSYLSGHLLYAFSGLWKKSLNNWLILQFYSKKGVLRKIFKKLPEARGLSIIKQAEIIKERYFKNESYCQDIKLYDWIVMLMLKDDYALTSEIKRFEADSNFFRSFSLVCILLVCCYQQEDAIVISAYFLFLFSLWRFVNRKFKAEEFASLYLIVKYKSKEGDKIK